VVVASTVPVIPDLDGADGDDLTTRVADAPRNATRKVQTLAELDGSQNFAAAAAAAASRGLAAGPGAAGAAADVDLSLLMSALAPPEAVEEGDDEWVFDKLLQEVAQDMQSDRERREGADGAASLADAGAGTGAGAGAGAAAAGATRGTGRTRAA
jgi:hypothetical protein